MKNKFSRNGTKIIGTSAITEIYHYLICHSELQNFLIAPRMTDCIFLILVNKMLLVVVNCSVIVVFCLVVVVFCIEYSVHNKSIKL